MVRDSAPPWPPDPPAPGEIVVAENGDFTNAAAQKVADLLRGLARERAGPLSIALAGGSTPRPVYGSLAALEGVPWPRLEIFFGDERAVPPDDPESNYHMVRESLLDRVPIPAGHVHRMGGEADSLENAAREYAALLPESLDVLLLGIGPDGHTASLFPEADTLRMRAPVVPATSPAPPHRRLTITPPVLERAHRIVVLARGAVKAVPVARALMGSWDPLRCPAQLARRGIWLLDVAAAAELPEPTHTRRDLSERTP